MEVTQLAEITQECRRMVLLAEANLQEQTQDRQSLQALIQLIRKRRIQITQLQYEAKHQRIHLIKRKRQCKIYASLEKQIKNAKAINIKSQDQQRRITQLDKTLSQKTTDLNTTMREKQRQENQIANELNIVEQIQHLRKEHQLRLGIKLKGNQRNHELNNQQQLLFHQKLLNIDNLQNQIEAIDQKNQQLSIKIRMQKEIIMSIQMKEIEQQDRHYLILDQDQQLIFHRRKPLDLWEIHQIQHAVDRREQASLRHQKQIGKIIKLRNRTEPCPIPYVNTNKYNNYSNNRVQPLKARIECERSISMSKQLERIKFHPLRELTERKSISTRRMDNKQHHHYKQLGTNRVNPNDFEPSSNIIDKYQKLKSVSTNLNNIEVFKLERSENRKRKKVGLRGLILERDSLQ